MSTRRFSPLMTTEFDIAYGNFDTTRSPITLIVLHTVVGTVSSAISRFSTPGSNVSIHYIVGYDGKIWGGLEEFSTAYQAGDYAVNQRSIGIEHEDMGNYDAPRPDALYSASAALVADICRYYAIPCDRQHVVKHTQVSDAFTPCPHTLDIDRIIAQAQQLLAPPTIDYKTKYEQARGVLYGPGTSWAKYKKLQTIII